MVDKVLHSQMPFTTGGQTINDRLTAAYHSLAGSQIGKTVCKATTEEPIGPKKKHLDYLLHCTHEPNVSIPQLANALVERTTNTNWCVVYKALITIHNVMCYGNERFCQYLASSNANFNLGNFLDKTSMQGYDMSTHVRRYAKYISEKVYTYRMVAFDFCKVKRGREDGFLRVMAIDKLLKTLPLLQGQIDALLEFQVTQQDLTNGVINCSFLLMFRDLIRLFACYNDGIINLLEKYFEMNKKQCAESLDLYKKFVERMDKVAEFLKVAETVGVDKGEIPDLVRAPGSLLESLENHLATMEGGKGNSTVSGGRVTSPVSGTFQQFATFNNDQNRDPFFETNSIDESSKRKIIQEEEYRMNALKEQKMSNQNQRTNDVDLFSPNVTTAGRIGRPPNSNDASPFIINTQKVNAIDDLLSLDAPSAAPPSSTNPFATDFGYQPQNQLQAPFSTPWSVSPTPVSKGFTNGRSSFSNPGAPNGRAFADENAFAKVFGSPPKSNNSGYGEYPSDYQVSGGLSQYAPSSRGISPAPEEEIGRNPFLTDGGSYDSGNVASGETNRSEPFMPTAAGDWHTGYDQEPLPKNEQQTVADVAAAGQTASFNPFAPAAQAHPAEMNSLDIGVGHLNFGRSPAASAISSALGSPSSVASPMRPFSQPMGIQQQPVQNVYPNLGGYDANYSSGGQVQYPRFMTPPPQPRAASSYGGPSVFESEMGSDQWNRPPARPPSAPPTELQGLDPLGDLLTPQPTMAAVPTSLIGPGTAGQQQRKTNEKILKGDLDSSLASLAENLNIGKGQDSLKKPVQWTGSAKPGQTAPVQSMNWNAPPAVPGYGGMPYQQQQPQQQPWGSQQPGMGGLMMGATMQAPYGQPKPAFGAPQQMMYPGGQLPGYGMAPISSQMPAYGQQQPRMPQQDPFGGL